MFKRREDQATDCLEKAKPRSRFVEAARGRRPELREQAGGVGSQCLIDGREVGLERVAQQRRDHSVGEPLLAGVGVRSQDPRAAGADRGDRFLREPGLADPRLALDHDERAVLRGGRVNVEQPRQLAAAPDERQLGSGLRRRLGGDRGGGRAAVDRVVEVGGFAQRCHAELAIELPHAVAVLHQRVAASPGTRVEIDQAPMGGLVQRVERKPLARAGDRLVEAPFAGE